MLAEYLLTKFDYFSESCLESSSPGNPDTLISSFPISKLQKLDELISNPRWVIPVLPKGKVVYYWKTTWVPPGPQIVSIGYL